MIYTQNGIKKGLIILLPLIFALFLVLTVQGNNYSEVGNDGTFNTGKGLFNLLNTDARVLGSKAINDLVSTPMVADLDNDGFNEIVVVSKTTVLIYNSTSLDLSDSITLSTAMTGSSNIMLYDILGDGQLKIIIASESSTDDLYILNYTNKQLVEATFSYAPNWVHTNGNVLIDCLDTNLCIAHYVTNSVGIPANNYIAFSTFNLDGVLSNEKLVIGGYSGTGSYIHTFSPLVKHLDCQDIDTDNDFDCYNIVALGNGGAVIDTVLYHFEINSTGNLTNEDIDTSIDETYVFTPITVANVDDSGSGKDIIYAYQETSSEFAMKIWSNNLVELHRFPAVANADGTVISNVIVGDFIDDTGSVDIGVVGYDSIDNEIDILVGSRYTDHFIDNFQFGLSVEGLYDIIAGNGYQSMISHAGQHSQQIQDGDIYNGDEIITPYGVFWLDYDNFDCNLLHTAIACDPLFIWSNGFVDNGTTIPVDFQNSGLVDLLSITTTNLRYIDDGFTNSPGEITGYSINPCLDGSWKVNTTVEIKVTVRDTDDDKVFSYTSLYDNHPNEMNETSGNFSSGAEMTFNYVANQTIGSGRITLQGYDEENPITPDEIALGFSVSTDGLEYGDCITTHTIVDEEEDDDDTDVDEDNVIDDSLDEIENITGLGLGKTIMWWIITIIIIISVFIFGSKEGIGAEILLIITAILLVVLIAIGAGLGYIGVGTIIIFSIVGLLIIIAFLSKFFFGGQ